MRPRDFFYHYIQEFPDDLVVLTMETMFKLLMEEDQKTVLELMKKDFLTRFGQKSKEMNELMQEILALHLEKTDN